MKKVLILLVIALFLVVGCGEEKAPEQEPVTQTSVKVSEPVDEEETVTVVKPTTKQMDSNVKELVELHSKVKSYSYYPTTDEFGQKYNYFIVKGNKMKIKLHEINLFQKETNFDTIYLDTSTKKAVAYCEDRRHFRCEDPNKEFIVSYGNWYEKLPLAWLEDIDYAEMGSAEMIDKRQTKMMHYEDGANTVKIWVDTYYGIPVKVQVVENFGSTEEEVLDSYGYRELSANNIKDSDMEHQEITDE